MPDPTTRRRRLGGLALTAALIGCAIAVACGGSSKKKSEPVVAPTEVASPTAVATPLPSTPTPVPTPKPPPASARPFTPDVIAQVQPLLDKAAQLRGMPPKGDVPMYLISRKDAIDDYRDSFEEDDLVKLETQQNVYKLLGMIPSDTNLKESFLSLLGGGILGYYDPKRNSFFLVDDIGGIASLLSRTTVVHEFSHALQDQYYNLNALSKKREDDWDATNAFLDTIEGDAVSTEIAYMGSNIHPSTCFTIPAVLSSGKLPYVIQRDLNTWYTDGLCFVKEALDKEGREQLFTNLPATTEQILHPEKYFAGEGAKPVTLPSLNTALGDGWKQIDHSDLGEYTLQNLLVLGLKEDRPRVQRAAAGWGGDAWALYGKGDALVLQVSTVWDSPEDAQDFFGTLNAALTNRGAKPQPRTEASLDAKLEANNWRVALSNDRVDIVVSPDEDALERTAGAMGMR